MNKVALALARGKWAIELTTGLNLYPRAHMMLTGHAQGFYDFPEDSEPEPVAHIIGAGGMVPFTSGNEVQSGAIGMLTIKGALVKESDPMCDVVGTMEMAQQVKDMAAAGVSALVVNIDSPGGQVDGTATLADAIKNLDIPTVAVVNDGMACSAGYWIASAADSIYCTHATSEVGSIGVYATLADFSEHYKALGIRVEDVYAEQSTEKNNGYREWKAGNPSTFQHRLTGVATEFIKTVKINRGAKLSDSATPFKGAVYGATEAMAIGLIDGIKAFDAVLADLQTEKLELTFR